MPKKKLTEAQKIVLKLEKELEEKEVEIKFLESQVRQIKQLFENAGTEKAEWKHKFLRLEDQVNKRK